MIGYSSDGITIDRNGVRETSKGPYGYLCLGLVYLWNTEDKCLNIDKIVLVETDLKLRCTIAFSFYDDMFEKPFSEVYEENGIFFFQGLPIINYKQLNIPQKAIGVKEFPKSFSSDIVRRFYNNDGPLQYSINRLCGDVYGYEFYEGYRELYSCALDFDKDTLEGTAAGFDTLGKFIPLIDKQSVDELYEELVYDPSRGSYWNECDEEYRRRSMEFGFLNLSYEIDDQGNKKYTYTSIWDDVDALIALNAQGKEEE